MAMEDATESCGNWDAADSSRMHTRQKLLQQQRQHHKLDVYNQVLHRLREAAVPEVQSPSFENGLWNHFNRLPVRYALDVNVERAEDVLSHKKLLELAEESANRPVFSVRLVQVSTIPDRNQVDSSESTSLGIGDGQSTSNYSCIHPPPAFGSSPNLGALVLEAARQDVQDGDSDTNSTHLPRPMHEITFSTHDKPKLLSLLTSLLGELGLNIQEAHAFSTSDGYSLDVFVVEGWPYEETKRLRDLLQKEIHKMGRQTWSKSPQIQSPLPEGNSQTEGNSLPDHVQIPTDGIDVWEINFQLLKFGNKVASGSYGDLYRGTHHSQDVAIKVLKSEHINADMQREFAQEVFIMRKVRHKNVVQFIGACTRPPKLCIVTEFMSGGSVYDYLHKKKGFFKLPALLQVAIDVSKGMNYLHQNNIIHRDLKAANLLMNENEVVKVADFGVARVKDESGVMTAETGTYRWMAPEGVIPIGQSIMEPSLLTYERSNSPVPLAKDLPTLAIMSPESGCDPRRRAIERLSLFPHRAEHTEPSFSICERSSPLVPSTKDLPTFLAMMSPESGHRTQAL